MSALVTSAIYVGLFFEGLFLGNRLAVAAVRGMSPKKVAVIFLIHSICIIPISMLLFRLRNTFF